MRLSQLKHRELINITNGERLGHIGNCELMVDEKNGKILSILAPDNERRLTLFNSKKMIEIGWNKIRKIGVDMIIVETDIYG